MAAAKRRPQRFPLRVIRGGFAPADNGAAAKLRERGYRVGDLVFAEFRKPRNPRFMALAHALGGLVAQNIDEFAGNDQHKVLKRLQYESGVGCEVMAVRVPGLGVAEVRTPLSLSFESMEEGEFREVMRGLCRHIAAEYWPSLEPEKIEQMAAAMVGEE